ncbi:EAL domain-containing protein [Bordetella avium]|uniref:EAL domain-containing protein n=1 Tax=Bordetella avium TaxID=521 RepID=UPI000E09E46E|nr:EAL domain-containing protein [Bordetella avium]AZY51680.1 hypothetical protein C0J07_03515 [Bordetella avium]RIQ13459.1 EAL domain-containing protein [Bordetella avium]RIQ16586.1 EAL domain-containing protein [Bordetella avium]RIQ31346.1 EAL domain-containing protein [Bordetella avium]RIQ36803.1 EAL domain-containing protein [Bordetella avium]
MDNDTAQPDGSVGRIFAFAASAERAAKLSRKILESGFGEPESTHLFDAMLCRLREQHFAVVVAELHPQHHDALRLPDALRERARWPVPHILWVGDYTPARSPFLPGESQARPGRLAFALGALVGGISLQALQAHAYLARSKGIHAEAVSDEGGLRQYLRMLARQPVSATLLSSSPQAPDFTDDELCEALESGRGMRVDLQPQFDLRTRRIVGAEALIRWRHTGPGDVPVSAMLPVVSRLGLDGLLFGYVRDQVIETLRLLRSHGRCVPIAINISAATLSQPGLISLLGERVREVGLGPELIKIELTEDAAPLDELSLSTALNCLRAEGFLLSLDDFGTGSASFELLADIPFDELKVAGKFVRDVAQRESCRAILAALSRLGRALNMCLVAECVETEADIACLRQLGVQVGQGYALCRPISAPDFLGRMMQQE